MWKVGLASLAFFISHKLQKIKGYEPLFVEAFGDKKITEARIVKALATYQLTLVSRHTDFDYFLQGDKKRLTDEQLLGLHLFRTKARCMNCHITTEPWKVRQPVLPE